MSTVLEGRVSLPEGTHGRAEVRYIEIKDDIHNMLQMGRRTRPGRYTALYLGGRLWMSDTDAEWGDHFQAVSEIRRRGGRVLINGLGIGMVVQAALDCPNVEHVDVVENDPDVAALVGPHYEADPRCTVHLADAYTKTWTGGERWSVAWHDIWIDLCEDNLPRMTKLHRKYGRRVGWQGSWGRELLRYHARRNRGWNW